MTKPTKSAEQIMSPRPGDHSEGARLTAAAPQMLEALKDALVFINDCLETGHDRGSIGNLMSARDVIEAAIALATGK